MKRGFTAYKSEQPLQSIVLQEKWNGISGQILGKQMKFLKYLSTLYNDLFITNISI